MGARFTCEIFPSDLDRTMRFYVDVLGFDVVLDERNAEPPYLALGRADVHLGAVPRPAIADPEARRPPVGVELVLEVHDLSAEYDRVAATGWPMTEDLTLRPWGLRDFRLVDPDGYYWRITEHGEAHPASSVGRPQRSVNEDRTRQARQKGVRTWCTESADSA